MKKQVMAISTILLIVLSVGITSAWFLASASRANEFKMGTVKVKVVEEGFEDLENVEATSYNKNVQVKSLGTKRTYVRVRLVPGWSNPSLPVSNVMLNLAGNSDWILYTDGYCYYKYYLTENQETSLLLQSVTFTELGKEYEGETFKLHVLAEGVQITNNGWQDVWGLTSLPFTPGIPKP
jgi:hypothetical protein